MAPGGGRVGVASEGPKPTPSRRSLCLPPCHICRSAAIRRRSPRIVHHQERQGGGCGSSGAALRGMKEDAVSCAVRAGRQVPPVVVRVMPLGARQAARRAKP